MGDNVLDWLLQLFVCVSSFKFICSNLVWSSKQIVCPIARIGIIIKKFLNFDKQSFIHELRRRFILKLSSSQSWQISSAIKRTSKLVTSDILFGPLIAREIYQSKSFEIIQKRGVHNQHTCWTHNNTLMSSFQCYRIEITIRFCNISFC